MSGIQTMDVKYHIYKLDFNNKSFFEEYSGKIKEKLSLIPDYGYFEGKITNGEISFSQWSVGLNQELARITGDEEKADIFINSNFWHLCGVYHSIL